MQKVRVFDTGSIDFSFMLLTVGIKELLFQVGYDYILTAWALNIKTVGTWSFVEFATIVFEA